MKPMTTHITEHEGGKWVPFEEFRGRAVHSIRFSDGDEWDAINGWRKYRPERDWMKSPRAD
jgi:hypothetical protein